MARRPVSVADFAAFVDATSYVTAAEKAGRSWVWLGGETTTDPGQDHLWFEVEDACWKRPQTLACHRPLKPSMAAWKPVSRGGTKTGTTPQLRQVRATRPMVSGWICGPWKMGPLSNWA